MPISNLSNGLRTGVCTSTNRPTTPYEGQVIYETDTDLTYVYNGSSWVPTTAHNLAAGVRLTADMTTTTNADSVITWSSASYDNNTMFSAGTPNRLTVKTAGIYVCTATIAWASNSTGERISWFQLNGSSAARWGNRRGGAWSTGPTEYSICAQISCAANDYIQVGFWQASGGNLALSSAATGRTSMEVARLSVV